jgi:hypothetical protein
MKKIIIVALSLVLFQQGFAQTKVDRSKKPAAGPAPIISINDPVVFTLANGMTILVVENHKLISNTKIDGIVTPVNSNVNDVDKFFLAINPINFKEGYQWADTIKVDSSIIINQYTINSQTPTTIEVLVSSNINMKLSSSVTGNNITQTMKGFSSGKRSYNNRSSLLVSELLDINIAGNIETASFNSPFTIKSTSQILVK